VDGCDSVGLQLESWHQVAQLLDRVVRHVVRSVEVLARCCCDVLVGA
jgi:hypothetical protein